MINLYKYTLLCSSLFLFPTLANADATYHPGIGIGAQYSGLGANMTRATDNDLWVVGGGLVRYNSDSGSLFGLTASYHRSDILGDSGEHAIGIGVGPVGVQRSFEYWRQDGWTYYRETDQRAVYGGMLMYNYYPRRMSLGGSHIGVSFGYGERDGRSVRGLDINFGYRF
ncbi:hypothetical protein CWE09_08495 [Aliidiomarina minuta]|uniref:Outer membrane protein beta-barrel domain-containing protein n=1 Tax=Aliidiomarina minuta TaxID=880057 RepID=A0A432W9C3_9GAMM|nr:hypothetical protein [Aliidiomarina minuta]RUO26724.1 hypothetical protein CWE09_08495 [Aliidiomarina minuta]